MREEFVDSDRRTKQFRLRYPKNGEILGEIPLGTLEHSRPGTGQGWYIKGGEGTKERGGTVGTGKLRTLCSKKEGQVYVRRGRDTDGR